MIGVHSPEFSFEREPVNVRRAIAALAIGYPVAFDSDHSIWRAFHNAYWPALYIVDARGQIRYHHFGEGDYETSELVIRQLLGPRQVELRATLPKRAASKRRQTRVSWRRPKRTSDTSARVGSRRKASCFAISHTTTRLLPIFDSIAGHS